METFAERLKRVALQRRRWAQDEHLDAYRLYDRDVPGWPLIVDLYGDHLHAAEVLQPGGCPPEDTIRQTLAQSLDWPQEKIVLKMRRPQAGGQQYEKLAEEGRTFLVREKDLKFQVNLWDYLDTGLFLDHRLSRQQVRAAAGQTRFLNLFAYTGSFSVYAAAGGAFETLTVDLNPNYLDWARQNLSLNGFSGPFHKFQKADALAFLRAESRRFDLIVLDPPTFSNSKKMAGTLDVQRDHNWMVRRCLDLLNPGGRLFFSNNYHKFKLDKDLIKDFQPRDVSAETCPPDFRPYPHQAWWFEKTGKRL